jgi:oligopeptide transport system ATP-binding protein
LEDAQSTPLAATGPLIQVRNLVKHFPIRQGLIFDKEVGSVKAVDGITFDIQRGETLGLVGESGCGKTTAGRTILGLYPPTSGSVLISGIELVGASKEYIQLLRRKATMIFQDPYSSLNPRWTVNAIIGEPLHVHKLVPDAASQTERVRELMLKVGLSPRLINRYPHEFSGGQRQRIGVARALASNPDFIVCDEPISNLDVSIQAQVVNLLEDLQTESNLTYLFIAHDLSMVRHICDRVAVMYLGIIVELGDRDELYENPLHPYNISLLSAVPIPNPKLSRSRQRIILTGDVPSPINPPSGCRFHPRCPVAQKSKEIMEHCSQVTPAWREIQPGHWVACHEVQV